MLLKHESILFPPKCLEKISKSSILFTSVEQFYNNCKLRVYLLTSLAVYDNFSYSTILTVLFLFCFDCVKISFVIFNSNLVLFMVCKQADYFQMTSDIPNLHTSASLLDPTVFA